MANPSVSPEPTPLNPSLGFATSFGVLMTILSLIGGVVAAIQGNDVATAGAAAGGILAAVTTLGGRYAQAVQLAKNAIVAASPWIDEAQRIAAGNRTPTGPRPTPPQEKPYYAPGDAPTTTDPELPSN